MLLLLDKFKKCWGKCIYDFLLFQGQKKNFSEEIFKVRMKEHCMSYARNFRK